MPYINAHEFTGRISSIKATHYFESGTMVTKFGIAVKPPYKSEQPIYCECEAWGKLAETAANWLQIGKLVTIQAEMKIETWTDKLTNEIRSKAVYQVNRLELLSGTKKNDELVQSAA